MGLSRQEYWSGVPSPSPLYCLLLLLLLSRFSCVRLFATPWTAAYQALLSMGFSRQEYESQVFAGHFLNSDMVTRLGPAPDLNKEKG